MQIKEEICKQKFMMTEEWQQSGLTQKAWCSLESIARQKQSLLNLGDYFRRMKAKGGNKYAIVATARKLAIIYYKMVRYKEEFNPVDLTEYQEKYKAAKIAYLQRKLEQLKAVA